MTERVCSVEGCGRKSKCRGWCSMHHQRWYAHGDPLAILKPSKTDAPCSVEGCVGAHFGKGYCAVHYRRLYRYGDALAVRSPMAVRCVVCDHAEVDNIELAVMSGAPVKTTARQFGVGGKSLRLHVLNHLDNPEWHAKRAAYWVGRLTELHAAGTAP